MPERIEIIVTTDAADASTEIENLADQVEELTGTRPEITVAADTSGAVEQIDAVGAATEGIGDAAQSSADSVAGARRSVR